MQNAVRGSVRRNFGEKFASRGHDKISNIFDISLAASGGGTKISPHMRGNGRANCLARPLGQHFPSQCGEL